MLGFYDNFPANIHRIERLSTNFSIKKLQQKLIRMLCEINRGTFSFEEIAYPTVPQGTIIFEFGLADAQSFNYINDKEAKKALSSIRKTPFQMMDFFCGLRYYKGSGEKKTPLKFDYYMLRVVFGKNAVEIRIFHERGPRYISPEDIITFLVNMINGTSKRTILKKKNSSNIID